MKLGRIALLLAGATALEFFFGATKYRGAWPVDWLLVATAIVARSGGFGRAVLTGAAAGFVEDALTETLLGLNAFATGTTAGALEAAWSFPWREWRERRRQGRLR